MRSPSSGGPEPTTLTLTPDSSQLFVYNSFNLSCGANSSRWQVRRSPASGRTLGTCGAQGGDDPAGCYLESAQLSDSAVYWCESPTRQRSNSVNVSVYGRTSSRTVSSDRPSTRLTETCLLPLSRQTSDPAESCPPCEVWGPRGPELPNQDQYFQPGCFL